MDTAQTVALNSRRAALLQKNRKFSESIQVYLDTLSLIDVELGCDHPSKGTFLSKLSHCYYNAKDYQNAVEVGEEALYYQDLNQKDSDIHWTLNWIALLCIS